jgi:hypothetical protein
MRRIWLGMAMLAGCGTGVEEGRYRVPDGFVVETGWGGENATGLTFDAAGRPVVVRAGREVLILGDGNGDGRYERETVFTRAVAGVRGMWWDGRTLYAAGEEGIWKCPDADGDDAADRCELVNAEKGVKAVRRGVDGEAVVMGGGMLRRWNRGTGRLEVMGSGLGEAEDFAVHLEGDVFGRALQVAAGGEYGGGLLETLPGGGRAGGVDFYQSNGYPETYRGALFAVAGGQVVVEKPVRCGGGWCLAAEKEFVRGEGVTDVEVGPDGKVWFTAGGLYRVAYRPGLAQQMYAGAGPAAAVVRQGQPLSSWGHAALLAAKARMGEGAWKQLLWGLALDRSGEAEDRVSALLILDRTGPRATAELLRPLAQDPSGRVRAAAVLVASFHSSGRAKAIVAGGLNDTDAFVRRRALEGLVRMGLSEATYESFAPAGVVYEGLNERDRAVRWAARVAVERYPRATWAELALRERSATAAPEGFLALTRTAKTEAELDAVLREEAGFLQREGLTAEQRANGKRALALTEMRKRGWEK